MLKICTGTEISEPRDLTGDLLRPPFCDWVMTTSHTRNWKLCFLSLRKYEGSLCKTKKQTLKHFLINVVTNQYSCTVRNRLSAICCSQDAKLKKKAMWQSCWTSQQVFRKGRVVKSEWKENILCGSTAWWSAQKKERKWAKCAQFHDGLYFTSLFSLSRVQIILGAYPVS